jgi:hypothetical protein
MSNVPQGIVTLGYAMAYACWLRLTKPYAVTGYGCDDTWFYQWEDMQK